MTTPCLKWPWSLSRTLLPTLALAVLWPLATRAQTPYLAYAVKISGNTNTPTVTVTNNSRGTQITLLEMTIGKTSRHFDGAWISTSPPNGTANVTAPSDRGDVITIELTGFDPGETFSFTTDIDTDPDDDDVLDYRNTWFNNGGYANAVISVEGGGMSASLTLPDGAANNTVYFANVARPTRTLTVKSLTEGLQSEGGARPISKATVLVNDQVATDTLGRGATNIGEEVTISIEDGATVEVTAPQQVYKNMFGEDVTDSALNDPQQILEQAQERFSALGISVNNEPQTGDPTLYRFDIFADTTVIIKWRHEYALSVEHDFTLTESLEQDATGQPWAGPLFSEAVGNPAPEAKKHWVARGQVTIAQIDGQVLDFNRAGLDVRYVPKAYRVYGPPNADTSVTEDEAVRLAGIDLRTNTASVSVCPFTVGQSPPRQQLQGFTMYGPGGIRYVWQIQFGVRVNVDDPTRAALPKIFKQTSGNFVEVANGEGTFWFDPGTSLRVATAANEPGQNGKALTAWMNGDGNYFSSSGEIDSSDGSLVQGEVVGTWRSGFYDTSSGRLYRGLEIPNLQRAARVLWRYGAQQVKVHARIGEYVFQDDNRQSQFTLRPDQITRVAVTGLNENVGDGDMAVWDPVAQRLYPLVPGIFKAIWRTNALATSGLEVIVTVSYPEPAHYPHIAGAPPVALDPDPADNFIFKEVKYTENQAAVDGNKWFTALTPGHTVLLFSQLQREGRGEPREFLQVRVVDTRRWDDRLLATRPAIIGQKITDTDLDHAGLGTGFVMFNGARYNPYVYDASKLEGLAAKDIYDLPALRGTGGDKILLHKDRLPGPVIPINVHPGASRTNRIVVVWYDDPAQNDELLWPHQARTYIPRWPVDESEGLGRIVIASQFGSESVATNGEDQVVVDAVAVVTSDAQGNAVTNQIPAETTYNPSRLQQVQIYSQADPELPGYNPNEEHALMAPSLRYAAVSPRPPAVYALRDNDLNKFNRANATFNEILEIPDSFTSHPFVLVQFLDTADHEFKMRVYKVEKEDPNIPNYRFARPQNLVSTTPARTLQLEPHIAMEAGEPVIPLYPLVEVIGASPCAQSFGSNLKDQSVYWEDHKGSSWAISGGENAWFTLSSHYPLAPDFWWPSNEPGTIRELVESGVAVRRAIVPQAGDCVSFLPARVQSILAFAPDALLPSISTVDVDLAPTRVLYKSDWPTVAPVLKAGETLTYQGGEYRGDHPFMQVIAEGTVRTVETPGLPAIVAFASAELVFDSLNPSGASSGWISNWTARVAQVLDVRSVPLSLAAFPPELQPATKRTRVKQGKYVFSELPASLQNRVLYDPLLGKLEMIGLLNDKEIGDSTLTAAPSAVYVLEPNIITVEEEQSLNDLSENATWRSAVAALARLSRNPSLLDTDNEDLPDPDDIYYRWELETFWRDYYYLVGNLPLSADVPPPIAIADIDPEYRVGLEPKVLRDSTDQVVTIEDPVFAGILRCVTDPTQPAPVRAFGPGLALLPNPGFLDPLAGFPEISWVTVVENNDPSLEGSPITVHVIQVDRRERYRGAIKTITSDNVFDENIVLRHQGDFGAHADELYFEWWYRPDDGSLNVPPPDLLRPGQPNPWKLFPDPSGNRGRGRYQVTLKGNPNAPEALLADTWWFARYRHANDATAGTNWKIPQPEGGNEVNFTWAGAGNSDPFNDFDADGLPDYRAQLAQGWIKRVLDAVNPYEARIRDFEGDNPATIASMIAQLGPRFEGPVALNPDKNVIENVGLIELYETILKRGRDLSINLSRPVSTPAIANALQLVSTRIGDFYNLLGNEAYCDALNPTIGFGSDTVEFGSLSTAIFAFQNQVSSLLEEELALLRGVDDYYARPVYNRLFWNFTKGEGEPAYASNYQIPDANMDGFIDEDDAMVMYPQGHGDAWGHYLTALRNQYDLLKHDNFNWVSRSEFYNLQDIVIKVDFLDERKFAQIAATKAKTGAEIVNLTYRQKYVDDPTAQWQGYSDSLEDRSWGVQGWSRRAGQGAYFDWVTANALLPSEHPNQTLEGIQKVDRKANSDIAVVSANLNTIQRTFDQANQGYNPLGIGPSVVPFDINPALIEDLSIYGRTHFEQVLERALRAIGNALSIWDYANESQNALRHITANEAEFRNSVFQEDLSYRNQLIALFGQPYEGTIGPGRVYPAGYSGPDLLLHMYVNVREIDNSTVPGPALSFASFDSEGNLTGGDIYEAFENGVGKGGAPRGALADIQHPMLPLYLSEDVRRLFAPTFTPDTSGTVPASVRSGWYAVNYTDLESPKVPLENLTQIMPVTTAGYTFQAPRDWGRRVSEGELQGLLSQMIQQEAAVASAIGEWDGLQGQIVRELRHVNAKLDSSANIRLKNEIFSRLKLVINDTIKAIEGVKELIEGLKETTDTIYEATREFPPKVLATAGFAFSPGDALSAVRGSIVTSKITVKAPMEASERALKIAKLVAEIGLDIAENELELFEKREEDALAAKEALKELENLVGDEPIKRIGIFKEIQNLRDLSEQYRAKLQEGTRLIDQRAAYNKRVAAEAQLSRYHDMTFRVARNHALQTYRSAFDLAARYAYLAAKAYDYELNLDPADAASPSAIYAEIIRARTLGEFDSGDPGDARPSRGGLAGLLATLKANYENRKSQLGFNNPENETGKISLRTELFRILPKSDEEGQDPITQPESDGFPFPGAVSDEIWRATLENSRVDDLWMLPEFRNNCRPFAAESDSAGNHVAEPGLVLRFSTRITAGQNFFGRPLSGGDHAYDPSHFATKIRSVGVWFSDYLSQDILNDLPATPRVYLIPLGLDVMSVPDSDNPDWVRLWKVVDQRIPVPLPALTANLDNGNWIPLLDSLDGRLGDPRKFSMFRAYHDGSSEVNMDELVSNSRLIGRSVWNTQWLLIIPGRLLNVDPAVGLQRFIDQVSDIKLVFQTYSYSGG